MSLPAAYTVLTMCPETGAGRGTIQHHFHGLSIRFGLHRPIGDHLAQFLFATMAIAGHVAPFAPVVRELVERGHEVTWYPSAAFAEKVRATGADFAPIKSATDFGDGDLNKHFPGRTRYKGLRQVVFDFEYAFAGSVEGYVTDLRELVDTLHPAALVTDPAVGAGLIMSIVYGIPTAIINVSVLGSFACCEIRSIGIAPRRSSGTSPPTTRRWRRLSCSRSSPRPSSQSSVETGHPPSAEIRRLACIRASTDAGASETTCTFTSFTMRRLQPA